MRVFSIAQATARSRSATDRKALPWLAIVPRELFDRAMLRKEAMAKVHPSKQRGRKHILSGLLRCGACGGGLYVHGANPSGDRRGTCSRHRESGDCPNPRTFMLPTIERAVLSGLREELTSPAAISEFVRAYHEERQRLAASMNGRREALERQIAQTRRQLDRIISCIADGHGDPAVLGPQSTALHNKAQALEEELAGLADIGNVVALHPAVLERYREHIDRLGSVLGEPDLVLSEATTAIRELIETVQVRHGGAHGRVKVQIKGRLAALLGPDVYPNDVWGKGERVMGIEPTS